MELKEILYVLKKDLKLMVGIFVFFLLAGFAFFSFQKQSIAANLMLNVTRKGIQQTQDYRYDDFYRLQADERFADTVVRWMGSPSIVNDITKKSSAQKVEKIKAQRLSSQVVEITFHTSSKNEAVGFADAVTEVLSGQAEKLDQQQHEDTWFVLVSNPVEISDGRVPLNIVFWASFALGLFFAFFGVLVKHYMKA